MNASVENQVFSLTGISRPEMLVIAQCLIEAEAKYSGYKGGNIKDYITAMLRRVCLVLYGEEYEPD